ncbi:hypothetical protein Tco_1016348 [Tanacetum coccineum]|uniref:Uncharacterized protein n=1 Tax=Tanacetum coccineum TaxID=301880 RepID=A0ABQ5FPL0_9ASTR
MRSMFVFYHDDEELGWGTLVAGDKFFWATKAKAFFAALLEGFGIRGSGYCLKAGTARGIARKNMERTIVFVLRWIFGCLGLFRVGRGRGFLVFWEVDGWRFVGDLVASIKAVSWVVLRSAAVLVAEMSWVRRSVSGGWLSSPVVSRRGGMAVGELRMKAPNDGTTLRTGRKRRK